MDLARTGSKIRDSCIGVIYNGLAYRSTESVSNVLARSVAVESAAYEHFGGETDAYKKKIRSLFSNLKGKTNKALGLRVMSNDITAAKFVRMTDDELKSDHQRQLDIEMEKENMKKAQVPMAEKSISDSLECGRCKQKKVSYTQAQTRSADEPMTTFCECLHCGNRWKVRHTTSVTLTILADTDTHNAVLIRTQSVFSCIQSRQERNATAYFRPRACKEGVTFADFCYLFQFASNLVLMFLLLLSYHLGV